MTLHELLDKVINSEPTEWHSITCWGAGTGPSYKDSFTFYTIYQGVKGVLHHDSHSTVLVFKPDVSITLAFGLNPWEDIDQCYEEKWAKSFPDKKATMGYVDVFYNNALVFRDTYVSVDGGRCKLPIPDYKDHKYVPKGYANFIELVDSFEGRSEFYRYFKQAGFETTDETWPEL